MKHHQTYTRHSIVPIEEVLPVIAETIERIKAKEKPIKAEFNGVKLNTKSLRLQTFLEKGLVCVHCGIKGQFFAIEKTYGQDAYHLNLWGVDDEGDERLFTHDHIIARSLNGKDDITNTQTMCSPCNAEKSIAEREQLER